MNAVRLSFFEIFLSPFVHAKKMCFICQVIQQHEPKHFYILFLLFLSDQIKRGKHMYIILGPFSRRGFFFDIKMMHQQTVISVANYYRYYHLNDMRDCYV